MESGRFDVVINNDLSAEEWEIAPNSLGRCDILHSFLSSTTDKSTVALQHEYGITFVRIPSPPLT